MRADGQTGALCLYVKAAERAHLPSQWWEKVTLSRDYAKALAQIDTRLAYWPKFLVHKCKQRLTRLTQVAIRSRKIAKEEERLGEKVVPKLPAKIRRREDTRERKAHAAAKVERAIERELVERLRSGAYGDRPLNVEEGVWKKVLKGLERAEKAKIEGEQEEEEEEEEEEKGALDEDDGASGSGGEVEYVSDLDEEEEEEERERELEMEDFDDWLGGQSADDTEETDDSEADDNDDYENDDDGDDDGDDKQDAENDIDDATAAAAAATRTGSKRKRQPEQIEPPAAARARSEIRPRPNSKANPKRPVTTTTTVSTKKSKTKQAPKLEIEYEMETQEQSLLNQQDLFYSTTRR